MVTGERKLVEPPAGKTGISFELDIYMDENFEKKLSKNFSLDVLSAPKNVFIQVFE